MIAKSSIHKNLKTIDKLYAKSISAKEGLFYSKLALLELCGWIEESMDDIVLRCAKRYLKNKGNFNFVKTSVIERTYGFEYHKHFRNMLRQVLGIIKLERLEHNLDPAKFPKMQASLESLKKRRDSEAHTHLKGVTKTLDAPSIMLSHLLIVYEGLKDVDNKLRSLKV